MERASYDRALAMKIQIILLLVLGGGNLWLWYVGHAIVVAAVLGIGFFIRGVALAWHAYGERATMRSSRSLRSLGRPALRAFLRVTSPGSRKRPSVLAAASTWRYVS